MPFPPAIMRVIVFTGAFVSIGIGGIPLANADDLPTGRHVAELLRRQLTSFKNHHSVGIFEDHVEGRPVECSRVTLYVDEFGRVVHVEEKGERGRDGSFHPRSKYTVVYNGEITVRIDFNYVRRLGPGKGQGKEIFVTVTDTPSPVGRHGSAFPLSIRNALRSGGNAGLLYQLQKCLKDEAPLTIARSRDEGADLVEMKLEQIDPKIGKTTVVAVVDLKKGAAVRSCRWTNPEGERAQESEAEYRETRPGSNQWFAAKGVERSLLRSSIEIPDPRGRKPRTIEVPPSESRFECIEYRNDDPEFTDAVFNVVLLKGTHVWDGRIQKDFIQSQDAVIRPPVPKERVPLFDEP
jgi:hypothetical protein